MKILGIVLSFVVLFTTASAKHQQGNCCLKTSTSKEKEANATEHANTDKNILLSQRIDYIEKNIDNRFNDFHVYIGIIIGLIIAVLAGVYIKGNATARATAKEDFEKGFEQYSKEIIQLAANAKQKYEELVSYTEASQRSSAEVLNIEQAIKNYYKKS